MFCKEENLWTKIYLGFEKEGILGEIPLRMQTDWGLSCTTVFCLGKFWVINGTWGEHTLTENQKLGTFFPSVIFCNPSQHSEPTYFWFCAAEEGNKKPFPLHPNMKRKHSGFNTANPLGTGKGRSLLSSCKQECLSTRHSGGGNAFRAFST